MKKCAKRILSLLIVFVMLLGVLPCQQMRVSAEVKAEAESAVESEKPLVKLLTLSDYQKWLGGVDDWEFLQTQLKGIVNGAYDAGVRPDYMIFGGDFSCLNSADTSETGMSQVKNIIRSKWENLTDERMLLVQGNHDPADTAGLTETGPVEFDDFIVYAINEDDFPSKQGESSVRAIVEKTAEGLQTWLEKKAGEGETRPVFIATHTGLHFDIDRKDGNNQYAYLLFDVINEAAKKLDLIYLFGHNHTNGDELAGGSLTCYSKGDKLGICTESSIADRSGKAAVLNFTYMNYGYVGYLGDIYNNPAPNPPADILAVSEWSLYPDRIDVARYTQEGLQSKYSVSLRMDHKDVLNYGDSYTVSYEADGGAEIDSFETVQSWNTVSRIVPQKEGAQFKCWSTKEDGTGNHYQPGDSIYIAEDTILYAQYVQYEEAGTYHLVDKMTPGKRYLLVWNSEFYTNTGTKYAMTDGTSNVTAIDPSWLSEDGNEIRLPMSENLYACLWDCSYNTGANPAAGYMLQNMETKNFLQYQSAGVAFAPDPTTDARSFFWVYKTDVTGENNNKVCQLAPYNSKDSKFIRYSVGSKKLKFGSTTVSTDPRNSTVYIYEKADTEEHIWKKADVLESNGEYLLVSGENAGKASAFTVDKRTIGEKEVEIQEADGVLYIDYPAAYNDNAVLHSYQVRKNEFWLNTWNYDYTDTTGGEVVYAYPAEGRIKITGNHFDDRYYARFGYKDGKLSAYKGPSGTETVEIVYNNGFTLDSGEPVSMFKRVEKEGNTEVHRHTFGEYQSDGNATCLVDGTQSAVCECGIADTQPLKNSKLKHNYVYDETIPCDEEGHYRVCSFCQTQIKEAHYGGTATAEERAGCEVCGTLYGELPVTVDKSGLKKTVANAVDPSEEDKYTQESWKVYTDALKEAEDVLADKDATQEEVDAAKAALDEAQEGLVPEKVTLPYIDVAEKAWYYDAIYYNYFAKTMTGLDSAHFGPDADIVRAQFATILYRMEGAPETAYDDKFPDIADKQYYTSPVIWASKAKVVTGYTDTGMFGPNDPITREQMAVMMYRYADYKKYDVSGDADYTGFVDASKISGFAKDAMEWAVANKIITGKDNGTVIDPQGKAIRAECAAIIQRFMEKYGK